MAKDREIVVIREDTGGGWIPGVIVGALIGTVVGLFTAPAPGRETRQKLLGRVSGAGSALQQRASATASSVQSRASEAASSARSRMPGQE